MKEHEGTITLTLTEVELLLWATQPREKQDLGRHFNRAKDKLTKLQKELKAEAAKQAQLFV